MTQIRNKKVIQQAERRSKGKLEGLGCSSVANSRTGLTTQSLTVDSLDYIKDGYACLFVVAS